MDKPAIRHPFDLDELERLAGIKPGPTKREETPHEGRDNPAKHTQEEARPRKSRQKESDNTFDPFATGVQSLRETFEKPSNPDGSLRGALTYRDNNDNLKRLIDSQAADKIAEHLSGKLARDPESGSWLVWAGTHWEAANGNVQAEKLLSQAIDEGCDPIGYRVTYLSGVTAIICKRSLLPPPDWPSGVIPFADGILDIRTRTLTEARPDYALDWCLPWRYDPGADCPTIKAWLLRSVDVDQETVELLRAWLAALVRGISLQHFLTLLGRGGSGKGTFQRLAVALIGLGNVAVTDLARLEGNQFETAKLYRKRLAMVNEAGRYGGSVDVLKAITGGDHVRLERKHQQQTGSFVFRGLVLMATNEPIVATDSTSGLERRRITVRFPRSATLEEKADWQARGGEEAVLHAEIPGLINWLLALSEDEIRRRIDALPERVARENLLGMAAGNSVADWLMECCVPVHNDIQGVQVGVKADSDSRLFPNYLAWCEDTGRKHPVSIRKFSDTLLDIGETLGLALTKRQHPTNRAATIYGLRLRAGTEEPHDWAARRYRRDANAAQKALSPGTEGFEGIEGFQNSSINSRSEVLV